MVKTKREIAILRGEWHPFVDADPARARFRELTAAGLSLQNIARIAGLRPTILVHLTEGSKRSTPARRIRPDTEAAILAVKVSERIRPDKGMVDAMGTHRRVQALVALGWTRTQLADRLGVKNTNLAVMLQDARVRASTATAVRGLYDELWKTLPPEDTPVQAKWARRSREDAAARGWPPPLAWDDEQLDRPDGRSARSWTWAHARRQLAAAHEPGANMPDTDIEAG